MDPSNIVLTGFMGTGKTTVGRRLAARLGRTFVDVDVEIAARAGVSIRELFADHGEAGFREIESEVCRDLATRCGLVVATGGGALFDPVNRRAFAEGGTIVCLSCEVDELLRRLENSADRPLLGDADRREDVERLLAERAETYEALPRHVDTSRRTPDEVVEAIADLLAEVRLPVRHPAGVYDVRIGLGGLERLGDALRSAGIETTAAMALVSNPTVFGVHGEAAIASLRASGASVEVCLVPDGEPHKRLVTVERLYDAFLAARLDRTSVVVGLGGGATTDIAGFAASTYLRGVRLVQVPTSLLAMVDASVGGKTGVDLPRGKNLVGSFWHPELVAIDPRVLRTLPAVELRSGLAETIKHGVLGDPQLFADLSRGSTEPASWWTEEAVARIERAVAVKIAVVEEDPGERGRRATLNLGHTVGHAVEAASAYSIRHGEAVAIGLVAAARLAEALGEASEPLVDAIEDVLRRWRLPIRCPELPIDGLIDAMQVDKKRTPQGLRWVLPTAIGRTKIMSDVPVASVRRVLAEMGARRDS